MKRNLIRATTVGAALGVAGLIAPAGAIAAPVDENNCAKVSTPGNPAGWGNTFSDEQGQAGKYSDVNVNVNDEDGSLRFETTATTPRQASYHSAGQLPLADVAKQPLTFHKSEGQANWQIRVTGAETGSEDGFATLVWTAPEGKVQADPAGSNQWYATRDLPGIPKFSNATLDKIIEAAGEKAVVNHYGISSQPAGNTGTVNVDNVSFNGCTTNFKATDDAGGFGSLENLFP
ncbi:hypothetical protein [Gordonia metallireducens]|uniref:hypothetical protein n=1 Tax=Gordonia metallireducens TaxID=2897779 RepID=UPI001E2AE917|nr:hypothetical protein [Gordonia metallireducens]